jgi:hypothetical protein
LGFCSGRKIELNSEYKEKWEFIPRRRVEVGGQKLPKEASEVKGVLAKQT